MNPMSRKLSAWEPGPADDHGVGEMPVVEPDRGAKREAAPTDMESPITALTAPGTDLLAAGAIAPAIASRPGQDQGP